MSQNLTYLWNDLHVDMKIMEKLKKKIIWQEKLDDSAYKTLEEYHGATVTLLTLISASTGDVSPYIFLCVFIKLKKKNQMTYLLCTCLLITIIIV